MNPNYNQEKEINLIDLMFYMLEHVGSIILVAIVGLILGIGIAYMQKGKAEDAAYAEAVAAAELSTASANEALMANSKAVNLGSLSSALSADDKKAIESYLEYSKVYDDQVMFNATDKLMQYDANNVYVMKAMFVFDAEDDYDVQVIVKSYAFLISSNPDLYEIVNCVESYPGTSIVTDVNGQSISVGDHQTGILYVTVKGKDEADADVLMEQVTALFDENAAAITNSFGKHSAKVSISEAYVTEDADILAYQQRYINNLYTYRNNMIAMEGKFTPEAKAYMTEYNKQLADGTLEQSAPVDAEITPLEVPEVERVTLPLSIKTVVLVAFVAVFLIVCFYGCMYIFSAYIRLDEEVDRMIGAPVLGRVALDAKNKGMHKIRYRQIARLNEKDAIVMAASSIKVLAKEKDVKNIYVSGVVMGEREKNVFASIKESLKDTNLSFTGEESILLSPGAMEQSAEADAVIFIEKVGSTRVDELVAAAKQCDEQGIMVLATIIVE